LRTDNIIILRPDQKYIQKALALAKTFINQEYDFVFNFNDSNRMSCTELIYCCYNKIIIPIKRRGKYIVLADDIANSKEFKTIWDSRING